MSALNKKSNVSIAEPEHFFTGEQEEIEEYKPKHPAIAFINQSAIENNKVDHLEDYVEVKPFEKK
tara:strand:+ start:3414 stop:3608 length:195 start_codon:yes stop_codon:yes gene_type:complete